MADTTKVVSEHDLEIAFLGTNFGAADHRKLIEIGVLKKACGYYCGHTLTQIMIRLKLIGTRGNVLKRGRELLRAAYYELMLNGG
ncbi:hypothetical protein ACOTC8_30030 [Achromobacter xylosoxidans]|uniref:hypothetical protein n=1 Tax=Alcaligenes xylosoxydans xylosoxydans TaxID=85698 RepID=UPI0006BF0C25|nr:hypothetical protein [Achromobacter xylosoxidans]CUJ42176.1 Uncharacterised protein [Achromobacter xylosoxidans]